MKKLKSITQFEKENELKVCNPQLINGGALDVTGSLVQGTTAAGAYGSSGEEGDTDCSSTLVYDDNSIQSITITV